MSVSASPPPQRPRLPAVPPPLATSAKISGGARLCVLCQREIRAGERECVLPVGDTVHVACVAAQRRTA
jgi:hypothetical protein